MENKYKLLIILGILLVSLFVTNKKVIENPKEFFNDCIEMEDGRMACKIGKLVIKSGDVIEEEYYIGKP